MAVTAWASTAAGIDRVLFKVNGATVATDYTAPYTYNHVTSSTVGVAIEVTARAVDANGAYVTTESLFIESVANIGSQSATITPVSADVGGDIAFRMVTTPPSGGTVDEACLYVDGDYGDGCIYPSSSSEDTLTLPAATFGVGSHIAQWHLYGTVSGGPPYYLDTGFARFTVTGASGVPSIAMTTLAEGGRYKGKKTVGVTVSGLPSSVTVQQVDFYEGGRMFGTDYDGAPYAATWNTAVGSDGSRTIAAEATLSDGSVLRTAVTATAANASASLTAPLAGASISGVKTLAGVGTYDADTALESGAFLVDGAVVATDRLAPFSYGWNTASVANGTHTVAMRLQLSDGRTMTTPPVSVTVAN
jgi:chitinase